LKSPISNLSGLLAIVFLVNGLFLPRQLCPGDQSVWRQEAESLIRHGHLWVDPQAATMGVPGQYFVLNATDGHFYSKYGIVNTLISLPPMVVENMLSGQGPPPVQRRILILNIWDLILSLALAAALYHVTRRYSADPRRRAVYVLACFYATFLWYYQRCQGGEIYQALFFVLFYECMLRGLRQPRWLLAAWGFVGLLILTRLFFGILIPLFIVLCLLQNHPWRRLLPIALLPPLLILGVLAWINTIKFGSPWLTGYHQWRPEEHLLTGSWLDGTWGLLFSGHWSVFVYFPLLFFALPNIRRFAADHRFDAAAIGLIFLTSLLVLGKIPTWRGEWSYGPRYLLFLLPILALPAINSAGSWRWAVAGVLLFSVWLQFEVITSEFWFFYRVQQPLDGLMDKETAQYFYDHPEGIIIHDLGWHGDHSMLMTHLSEQLKPDQMAAYRRIVDQTLHNTNLYWWPPR
jgi:hypothetical protein